MNEKYDFIGKGYNTTRTADPYLVAQLYYHLNPITSGNYLDIGCGTGNYTNALYKKGVNFIGIDPSEKMLQKAQQKNKDIIWKQGHAENISLTNESIEGIIGSLTLHHWTSLQQGFSELYRVLKPYGNMVFLTSTPAQMQGYWLNHYFPKMLQDSMLQMPSLQKITEAMQAAGFNNIFTETYTIAADLKDLFLYSGKHHPEFYLNENIRNGISSFSDLANKDEVEKGLLQLQKDINSGKIKEVIRNYENNNGDYLFILTQK